MTESLLVVVRLPTHETEREGLALVRGTTPQTSSADEGDASEGEQTSIVPATAGRDRTTKKRKPTYEVRKDEIANKKQEIVALREELHQLKAEQLQARQTLADKLHDNAAMQAAIARNHLIVASAQSLASSYQSSYGTPPTSTYIHLPTDLSLRQRILESLKPQKMQEALAFMFARMQHTDLRRQSRQMEAFEAINGDHIMVHWEVSRISSPNASVMTVFDHMGYFKRTMEMTLAEKLGVVSIRESDSCDDGTDATQVRMVSQYGQGIPVEKNVIMYAQYYPKSAALDAPHGLMVTDYVDHDDLYPYQSKSRVRKDVSSVTMVVECPSTSAAPTVALIKWSFMRIHQSSLATAEQLDEISREGVRSFFDVMVQTIRERLLCH